jgi:hypothetical protein
MGTHRLEVKKKLGFWQIVVALFALLTTLIYLPALTGRIPFPRDAVLQFAAWGGMAHNETWKQYADIGDLVTAFYPARAFAARTIHEGSLPLWNPYLLGGTPFLANPQSSLFYPPNVLYYILPLPAAWTLCLMLRVFLCGVFMTLFTRRIGGSKKGSIFSGLAFTLCGFMTGWQGQPMDDSATWLPLMCYAVLCLETQRSARWIALAAFAFAMPILAGHPETTAHVTLVASAIAVVTWISSRFRFQFAWRFAVSGILAGALASIQIIPTLEWLKQMPGALDTRWPTLPLHQALAWVSRDIFRSPNSAGILIPVATAYIGMITLLCAPFGLLHRAKKHSLFLAILTMVALAIAYGFEPVHSFVSHVPVLAGLKNDRMVLLASFGIAGLAGLGISVLEKEFDRVQRNRFAGLALLMIASATVFVLVYKLRLATGTRIDFMQRPSFSRAMLIISILPLLLRLYGGLSASSFSTITFAVLAFDLVSFSYGYTGFAARDDIFPQTSIFQFLARNADPATWRVLQIEGAYPPNASIMYGLASADGYEVRLTPWHLAFSLDYNENLENGIAFTGRRLLEFNDRRLDMLNVKYVVVPNGSPEFAHLKSALRFSLAYNDGYTAAFENKTVLPRAFIVPAKGVTPLGKIDNQLGFFRNSALNPQQKFTVSQLPAVLEEPAEEAGSGLPLTRSVEIEGNHANDIELRASTPETSVLVLSQTYYPGWKALVDGRRTDVFQVDLSLTGVRIPPGVHDVQVFFRPTSFQVGAVLSIASTMVLLGIAVWPSTAQKGD